ncbi:MAG: hypothetical protein WCO30_00500 [bacterium]
MGKGNIPGCLSVRSAREFHGAKIKNLFAQFDPSLGELRGPIIVSFYNGMNFTLEPDKAEVGISKLLAEKLDGINNLTNSGIKQFQTAGTEDPGINERNCDCQYFKAEEMSDQVFSCLLALADEQDNLSGSVSVCFRSERTLMLDVGDTAGVWYPILLGDFPSDITWVKLNSREREELDGILLHNDILAGRFSDMTGKEF